MPNVEYTHDYLAVINLRSTYKESKELAERLASEYNSIIFLLFAYQANLYMADIKNAELLLYKIIGLSNEDDRIQYMINFDKSKNALIKYQEISGMQENDIKILAEIVMSALDDNHIPIITINYISSGSNKEKINAYRVTAECDDPQVLADMNIQLSYKLASYDIFLDKVFSVLILGVDDLSSISRRIKWL